MPVCETCKEPFVAKANRPNRFCSRPCTRAANGGQNKKDGPIWWVGRKGYIEGRIWVNGQRVFRRQHRWVMEQHLGRPLEAHEDVHHRNRNKQDNRLENLELVDHGEHTTIHNEQRVYQRGYRLVLSEAERLARAERMRQIRWTGREAIAKAEGKVKV